MKKYANIIVFIGLLILGIGLIYYTIAEQNFEELKRELLSVNYYMIIPVLLVSITIHAIRAYRWQLLVKTQELDLSYIKMFHAMMLGYFLNYAIPRSGEFARCGVLTDKKSKPFMLLFGTVTMERLIDTLCLAILSVFTFTVFYGDLQGFLSEYILAPLIEKYPILGNKWIWATPFVLILVVSYFLSNYMDKEDEKNKEESDLTWDQKFTNGLTSIIKLKQKGLFGILTVLIWVGYFLTSYLWFFGVRESSGVLGLKEGIILLTIGTFARSIPIQGGAMGAYHFVVTNLMVLLGLSSATGFTLATVIHGTQLIYNLLFGAISIIYFTSFSDLRMSIKDLILKKED